MKNTGVWLDRDKAIVVTLNNGKEVLEIINSEIEDFKATSSRLLGGHQEIAKDRKFLEREKHQFKNYFKEKLGTSFSFYKDVPKSFIKISNISTNWIFEVL